MLKTKRGYEIDIKDGHLYSSIECLNCGKERWVRVNNGVSISSLCIKCKQRGENHHSWKGGTTKRYDGYMQTRLSPDSPYFPMVFSNKREVATGVVLEHRLVMAKHLNRCLLSWEIVHHKNGVRK